MGIQEGKSMGHDPEAHTEPKGKGRRKTTTEVLPLLLEPSLAEWSHPKLISTLQLSRNCHTLVVF